ncbi:MAG: NADP-dependent phosphogluconate dehydrogenase [Pseudomonadota bacterium]
MGDADIGLIGLGTMGGNLALNIAETGFRIAVWNRRQARTDDFFAEAGPLAERIVPTSSLEELAHALKPPRAVILMVPAGDPVDEQIAALTPLLDADDLIIDAGNANFRNTRTRSAEAKVGFMGIGVSGGAEGARHGPSIMGGGAVEHWERVGPILRAIAAEYEGEPCATHMGPDGAGHFVKAVHNGIEYADMQLIAEVYGLMRDGLGMPTGQMAEVFGAWNEGVLASYLIDITAEIAGTADTDTGQPMLDVILDKAGQKGTGRWTAIEAQHLGAPIPVIEAAVAARNISALKGEREAGEGRFGAGGSAIEGLDTAVMEDALIAGKILCYAQGFDMMRRAAEAFDWPLPMPGIARVWRAGCIIRSAMLDDMASSLAEAPARSLRLAPFFAEHLEQRVPALRRVVAEALMAGHAVPALAAALTYFDAMRTGRGTANMLQAQRDFFGAHGFERVDRDEPDQHGPWVT